MVSTEAGVSQQGQNRVSMDAQTCLACKSNWCTTWPQEVTTHVPDSLMAEYPTPRLVREERATLVSQSGPQQTSTLRFPWGVIFIHLCQNSSSTDNLSSRTIRQWAEFKTWVKLGTEIRHTAMQHYARRPRLVKESKFGGYYFIVGSASLWLRHGCAIRKRNSLNLSLNWWTLHSLT